MATSQKYFLRLLVLFYAVVLAFLAYSTHWADTELWSITIAQRLLHEGDYSLVYKFVFNFILKCVYFLDLGNIPTIHVIRFIFCLFGLGIVYQVYWIGKLVHKDERKALFSCLLLITSSYFLSRGFRVRSDLLACFFQLLYISSFLRYLEVGKIKWLVVGLLSISCMLLSTPKSVFFLIVIFAFIGLYTFLSKKKEPIFNYVLWTFLVLTPFGFIALLMNRFAFLAAHQYFMGSFQDVNKPSYFSIKGFYFVIRFLQENPIIVFTFILYIAGVIGLSKVKKSTQLEKSLVICFFLSLCFIIFHNDRLPFFINTMLVFPIMLSGWYLWDVLEKLPKQKWGDKVTVIMCLVLLMKGSYYAERFIDKNSNYDQKKVIRYMESYLNQYPKATYYDGMGSMPRLNKIFHFITSDHMGNDFNTIKTIRDNKPDIILFSNRMFYQMKSILDFLKEMSYFHMGQGVYVRSESDEELKGHKVYMYEGPSFLNMKFVEGKFSETSRVKLKSRFSPIELPNQLNYYEVFDFDPKY